VGIEQKVFRGEVAAERRSWQSVRGSFRVVRPHDDPAYLELMAPQGAANRMLYFASGETRVMYAFHIQPLDPAVLGPAAEGWSIVTSPYGYGGPLIEVEETSLERAEDAQEEWRSAWSRWVRDNRVVSEFVREDLHQERLIPRSDGCHSLDQVNVIVPLDVDPDLRWRSYAAKVRKNVRRAQNCGLRVEFNASDDAVAAFYAVYSDTMQRRNASDAFEIGLDRMMAFVREARESAGAVIALTLHEDAVKSAELVLVGSREMYSFLGGTLPDAFPMRPNDVLKHEACEWGARMGLREYVLGGGFTPGDGIFQYKTSFAPGGLRDYYTRRVVHDPVTYASLVGSRRAMEARSALAWEPRESYFPAFLS